MAGVVGFEPTVHGTKNRCLTAWLHPNVRREIEAFARTSAARGGLNLDASVSIGPANFCIVVHVRGLCGARFGRSDAER